MTAQCVSCGRIFETSEAVVRAVQDGSLESLCPYCDASHDDGAFNDEDDEGYDREDF